MNKNSLKSIGLIFFNMNESAKYLVFSFFLYIFAAILKCKTMEKNELKYYEKAYGKKICTEKLNIEGLKGAISFDIYDGYAVCENYRGHRYDMSYPQLRAIKESKELSDAVIDYVYDAIIWE